MVRERCVTAPQPFLVNDTMIMRIGRQNYDGANRPSYTGEIQHVATFDAPLALADVREQVDSMVNGTRILSRVRLSQVF